MSGSPTTRAESEGRQAKVLMLYAKGMTQSEIAAQLGVQQSTVSKDLQRIRKRMQREMRDEVRDSGWQFAKYITGMDAAISKMWEVADDKSIAPRERIQAISQLIEFYDRRGEEMILASRYFERKAKNEENYGR